MQVQPYLFFNGRCEEAADFYRRTIGAEEIMLMRWKDCPEPQQPGMVPPGSEDKVMHMALRIGDTTVLASDGRCTGHPTFQGFSLSVTVPSEAEAEKRRIEAEGQASAIFAKLDAEARGQYEILAKKGDGLKRIIEACGGAQPAFQMMMLEHLDTLAQTGAYFRLVTVADGLKKKVLEAVTLKYLPEDVEDSPTQRSALDTKLFEEAEKHIAFAGFLGDEIPEVADFLLADAMDASEALFEAVWIPG